jgi:hypothetical protein
VLMVWYLSRAYKYKDGVSERGKRCCGRRGGFMALFNVESWVGILILCIGVGWSVGDGQYGAGGPIGGVGALR